MTGISAADLPPETRTLAELLLERLSMASGKGRVELEVDARGQLLCIWKHEQIAASELGRFDSS